MYMYGLLYGTTFKQRLPKYNKGMQIGVWPGIVCNTTLQPLINLIFQGCIIMSQREKMYATSHTNALCFIQKQGNVSEKEFYK